MYKPIIIIDHPTLSQNIGAVARAMLNFNLSDLRIIAPRPNWLNDEARALAAGADKVLEQAQIVDNFNDAIHDLKWIFATTARPRDMNKPVINVKDAVVKYSELNQNKAKIGFVFGSEKSGLPNNIIALCNAVISIPLNPEFTSINLAQSVIIIAYELYQFVSSSLEFSVCEPSKSIDESANKNELLGFFEHLEAELLLSGYLRTDHKNPLMIQTLRNIFSRMLLSSQEVRTLRGVIASLVNPHGIYSRRPKREK